MFGYSEKNSLNKDISDLSKTINYNHILQKFDFTLKISKEYIYIPTEISLVPIFFTWNIFYIFMQYTII